MRVLGGECGKSIFSLGETLGDEHVGLYRDDRLGEFPGMSNSEADRTRKKIVKIFKDNGLSITVEINLKCTDFLDITLEEQYTLLLIIK